MKGYLKWSLRIKQHQFSDEIANVQSSRQELVKFRDNILASVGKAQEAMTKAQADVSDFM